MKTISRHQRSSVRCQSLHPIARPVQLLSTTLVLCALAVLAANAQAQVTRSVAATEPAIAAAQAMPGGLGPQVQRQGDVAYVTGGIGDVGQARTMALGRGMNLQMVFAQNPGGHYLAMIDVAVVDSDGNIVLGLDSSGPLLFAQLDPGRYQATATVRKETIHRNFEVPASGQHVERFIWKK